MVVTDNPEYEHFKHVPAIQSWIKTQSHLPQNIRKLLSLIIISDLIKKKKKIDSHVQIECGCL